MLWDVLVVFLILAFAYALAFKSDVPPIVTKRSLLFFGVALVVLNIFEILSYFGRVLTRIVFGG